MTRKRPVVSTVSEDGLRYSTKKPGSLFDGYQNTMSCFKCGTHRIRSDLQNKRIIGSYFLVCKEGCSRPQTTREPVVSEHAA